MPTVHGVINGKIIELDRETGLTDGQEVIVSVQPISRDLPAGEGIRRSAGAWADSAQELDEYLQWNRQQRKIERQDVGS